VLTTAFHRRCQPRFSRAKHRCWTLKLAEGSARVALAAELRRLENRRVAAAELRREWSSFTTCGEKKAVSWSFRAAAV